MPSSKLRLLRISAIFIPALALIFGGCSKQRNTDSNIPKIDFRDYQVKQDDSGNKSVTLFIDYTDGDGDIGYSESDTMPPFDPDGAYYYDIVVNYYERIGGKFIKLWREYPFVDPSSPSDTIRFNGRIPNLTPDGRHKSIKGTLEYTIIMSDAPKFAGDPFKYEIWIYDRALHKSNVIESPQIVF